MSAAENVMRNMSLPNILIRSIRKWEMSYISARDVEIITNL